MYDSKAEKEVSYMEINELLNKITMKLYVVIFREQWIYFYKHKHFVEAMKHMSEFALVDEYVIILIIKKMIPWSCMLVNA